MIQIGPTTEVIVAINPVDFRCGIETLCSLVKSNFHLDPYKGTYFLFTNKRRSGIKILSYDGQGFWFCYKRLSQGRLRWWPSSKNDIESIDVKNVMLLIYNGDVENINFQKNWKKV